MAYTYDDFLTAANSAGMLDQFDQMDLETARRSPEFGLSLLSLKKDVANATTDEQRLLANEAANQLRKSYGSYVATDGETKYASAYDSQIKDAMDAVTGYGDYNWSGQEEYDRLHQKVMNPESFEYDHKNDPNFSGYKKTYLREGDRAVQDTLAKVSAATGGVPSSYAVTAATQAGNYYGAKVADMIPAMREQAYEKYLAEQQRDRENLALLESERQQGYATWLDGYTRLQEQLAMLQNQDSIDYGKYLDQWNMAQQMSQQELATKQAAAELMASKGDYTLMGQLYGLTQEQIDVLNGNKSAGGYVYTGDPKPYGETELDGSGVSRNGIINMQYSLGVTPTGVWDEATAAAAGYAKASDAYAAWNKGKIGSSGNKQIDQVNRVNQAVKSFDPLTSDKNLLEKQILSYAMRISDTEVGKEVGAQLLAKYGLAE